MEAVMRYFLFGHAKLIMKYCGPEDNPQDLVEFISVALSFAERKLSKLEEQYDAEAKAIPHEALLASPRVEFVAPDHHGLTLSRGELRKAQKDQQKH